MTRFSFSIAASDGAARTGAITMERGAIRTPAFMPVGTAATVKAMKPDDVRASGADIILGNTYHLMLRPGAERIARLGGLHKFMGWDGPILTDSGGFQVFSLDGMREVTDAGVTFASHLDGAEMFLSPECVVESQARLGANFIMIFPGAVTAGGARIFSAQSSLTEDDAAAIKTDCPSVAYVSAGARSAGTVVAGENNWSTEIFGSDVDWPFIRSWNVASGSFFSESDVKSAAKVAVLGNSVKQNLFPDSDPLGAVIRVKNVPFRIIGVLSRKGATLTGQDSQTLLRAEAEALDILYQHGVCPRRVDLFTGGDSLFLVEEALPGRTLADWVNHRIMPGSRLNDALPIQDVLPLAAQIVDVVGKVHAAGLRFGDLAPNNLMVCEDGSVRCIDLEGVGRFGAPVAPIGTRGYFSPEFKAWAIEQIDPGVVGDLYALGAVLFFLVTGADPVLLDDDDNTREDRLSRLFDLLGSGSAAAHVLRPVISGLMADDPAVRWPLDRVRAQLAGVAAPVASRTRDGSSPSPHALLADLVEQLAETAIDEANTAATSDPRTVYAGAAGLLAVLARIDPRSAAVDALVSRIYADPPSGPVLPGLYTGVAGIAWAGFDAARLRGEDPSRALALARQIPTAWHVPDVCHGLAGAGLAFAHLWQNGAGEECRNRVADCADNLTRSVVDTKYGLMWPFPPDADTVLAGRANYGFAHGVAGIGTFLLAATSVTGDSRYRDLAVRAGQTLAANVQGDEAAAWWYADPDEQEGGDYPVSAAHWCNGASGIGTFLLRLGRATNDPTWIALARRAATTVRMEARGASVCYCHGLAGNADFLLDMADSLGDEEYRTWAEESAHLIAAPAARRNGKFVIADDTKTAVTSGFATGTAGTAVFLHRLVHGGGRWWMPE
jgi:serine/threonine protein kinase